VVTVNGDATTRTWAGAQYFTWSDLVAHAARNTRLRPGDVLGSGTLNRGCLLELGPLEGDRFLGGGRHGGARGRSGRRPQEPDHRPRRPPTGGTTRPRTYSTLAWSGAAASVDPACEETLSLGLCAPATSREKTDLTFAHWLTSTAIPPASAATAMNFRPRRLGSGLRRSAREALRAEMAAWRRLA